MSSTKRTVAVVGASAARRKFGNKSLRAHLAAGWRVIPVNLQESEIEGLSVVKKLAEIEEPLDRITLYLPPHEVLSILPEIAALGADEVWFNPGSATREVLDRARELGIPVVDGCSIVDLGLSPVQFP